MDALKWHIPQATCKQETHKNKPKNKPQIGIRDKDGKMRCSSSSDSLVTLWLSVTADFHISGLCSVQSVGSFVFVSCDFKRGLGTFTDRLKEHL